MPADPKAQIERINQVSAMARTSWIALLGYLAFVGVTLLGVEDADFFVPTRQTRLPLVSVDIPTASFFVFAPILAAALYVYLQIVLLKLWDAIGDLTDSTIDGQPVGDALVPWLVNDWALSIRGGAFIPARPLRALGNLASFILVWAAAPLALFFFWWWSMPAHRPLLSLLLAGCFLITLVAGLTGWQTAHAWLSGKRPPSDDRPPLGTALLDLLRTRRQGRLGALAAALGAALRRHTGFWALAAILACITLVRTAWPIADNPPLARADVTNVEMVDLPEGWRAWETAREAYRDTWCRRQGLEPAVCGPPPNPASTPSAQTLHDRAAWCDDHDTKRGEPCDAAFLAVDSKFREDWWTERMSAIADLPRLDLSNRDLRRAIATGATLVGADLTGARLQGADLRNARLEGAALSNARLQEADLRNARLEGADLGGARLEGADLSNARLLGADLRNARLEGANLISARLQGADLSNARLLGADLSGAWLEGANLISARLQGADLTGAQLEEANLGDARLEGAHLAVARLEGAYLRGARLEGADLRSARLEGAYLGSARLEGADLGGARLEGADLRNARLEGADLLASDFRKSKWDGASNRTSPAQFADLRSAQGLTQAQLDNLIGNAGTLLTFTPESVQPLYVWSCWETPPEDFDALVARVAETDLSDPESVRAEFLCGPDTPRRKTGTPLPLDAPYPEGHPLAGR